MGVLFVLQKPMTTHTKRQHLFCPGPVQLAKNVKKAAVSHEIGHREPEFSKLLESINNKILDLFHIKNRTEFQALVVSGSGTAGNEAVLSSAVGKKTILVLVNGEFGERLLEISRLHNPNTIHLSWDWGTPMDLSAIEDVIKSQRVEFIAMVHHETSTGMLNPIEDVGKLAATYNSQFFIDTVSSAGAEDIHLERTQATYLTSSASKAIGSLPGVSIVVGRINALEALKDIPPRTVYLNLYKFYRFAADRSQTPNTPAVQSFFALEQALENIVTKQDKHFARMQKLAAAMRKGLSELGLKFVLDTEHMSVVLTTVYAPEHVSVDILKSKLRARGIVIYDGKGPLAGKVFQVSTIGSLSPKQTQFFLKNLKQALKESTLSLPTKSPLMQKSVPQKIK